jgi:hypothetical protein
MSSNIHITDCDDFVQLTFDIKVNSRSKERVLLQKIISYVSDPSIQLPPIMHSPIKKCEYIEHDLSNLYATPDDLNKLFKKMSKRIKNIEKYIATDRPVTITNNASNIVVNVGCNIVNKTSSDKSKLEEWIQMNPIEDKILQSEYRQMFLNDTGITIHPNTFGKIASKYITNMTSCGKTYYKNK